ncbi:MAG: hypothetical protein ACLPLR_02955 [Terriglobales bacterium]
MKAYLLGAGASKSYDESPTGLRMPLARDLFQVFSKLAIHTNPWVLTGAIMNYVSSSHGIPPQDFSDFADDIEELHSEVQNRLIDSIGNSDELGVIELAGISNQLVFLFASVINEIQNGPVSKAHLAIAQTLDPEDRVLTLNWDTLMDRALAESTDWRTDSGYLVKPRLIHRGGWVAVDSQSAPVTAVPALLKLHGSTNWISSYNIVEGGKISLIQSSDPSSFYVYESADKPYATFAGRYMAGYAPFSYGYYPPNIPDDSGKKAKEGQVFVRARPKFPWMPEGPAEDKGLVSMPLIIPPVKEKTYELFGVLFKTVWTAAEDAIAKADHIIIIGYSFPRTDHKSSALFARAFARRQSMARVSIIDPDPDRALHKMRFDLGIDEDRLSVYPEPFSKDFDLAAVFQS